MHRIPSPAKGIAQTLRDYPGVVGVFWGHRRRGGRWLRRQVLSIHVVEKRAVEALLADGMALFDAAIGPYETDVIEVGRPRSLVLDLTDPVIGRAIENTERRSSITLYARANGRVLTLSSGHGVLPTDGRGRLLPRYRASEEDGEAVRIHDHVGDVAGRVLQGEFGGRRDWAVSLLAPGADLGYEAHSLAGRAPVRRRRESLAKGTTLRHQSLVHGRTVTGEFRGVSATSLEVVGPDDETHIFSDLLWVESQEAFADPGDSGSLVFDLEGRAVGVLSAGAPDGHTGYLVPVSELFTAMGATYDLFFE